MRWWCQCDCGNKVLIYASALKSGLTQSCGCYHRDIVKTIFTKDITGQKFGKLTAISPEYQNASKTYVWKCKCDCGSYVFVSVSSLLNGTKVHCGCLNQPLGEYYIEQVLKQHNILYYKQYTFTDLRRLRFDFYLPEHNRLIEFDGEQHFYPIEHFGGEESYNKIKQRDLIKNKYAI